MSVETPVRPIPRWADIPGAGLLTHQVIYTEHLGMPEGDILDRRAVADLLGVTPATISNYLYQSKPGGRYADHPFPEPDDRAGRSPVWLAERADEITAWATGRTGQGVGGGQPAHRRRQR